MIIKQHLDSRQDWGLKLKENTMESQCKKGPKSIIGSIDIQLKHEIKAQIC